MLEYRHRPGFGLGLLLSPLVLTLVGAGISMLGETDFGEQIIAVPLIAAGLLMSLPLLYTRTVHIDEETISVTRRYALFKSVDRVPRSSLRVVHWEETRPKPSSAGSSHTTPPTMRLLGDGLNIVVPEREYSVQTAVELGSKLGVPVRRLVQGDVAEEWP